MTVLGLERILLRNFSVWEPFFLKDTKVVVDANDLVGFLHDTCQTESYGGENLSFYMNVRSFLSNLKCSNVEPYFLLRGCCDMKDCKVEYRKRRESNFISEIATALKLNAPDKIPNRQIFSSLDIFIDAVNEFQWKCIRVKSLSTTICTAVATILRCPIIGLSSDYYILMSKSQNFLNNSIFQPHSRPTFLTLRLANINLSLLNSSTECNVEKPILFHRFIPQLSILMKCSDFHLPLLAVLFGTDVVPHVKLPLRLQEKLQANNSSLDHKEHRLSVLLEWFSQFQPNSIEPLEDVINCYPFKQRTSMINSIVHGISNFICPLEETKDVMSLLNDKSYSDISRNTFTTTKSTLRSNNSFKDVIDSLQGTNVVYLWHEDYTKGWPPRLLDNFRKGKVYPISSIYSTGGAFRRAAVEDPKCPFSVYESSFLIRRLHYQVYVSLERSLGMENKLVGLNPDVIEYVRRNDKLVMYRIPIKSIPLSFGKVSTDEVIKDNLGFVTLSENNLIPNFLYSLAVVLAYWFQQLKYTSTEIPSVFSESSVGLAVAACAVANIYNDGSSSISELCEFYNNLSRMPDQSLISGSISTAFRPDIVHSFNAIQLTFNSFRDLVTTLNCLVSENRQSNHFAFSQVWILFPSGNLVHFLATQLASLDPSNRRSSVLRVWLPRLLFIRERNYDAALKLNKVVKTLTAFIDLCDMIKINIPSSLDSFYSIHELESTCFPETMPTVPKLYSSNNTNLVNERPHSSFNVRFSLGYREKSGNMTSNSRIHNKLPAENGMHSAPVRHHSSNNFHSISKKI